jgi:acyl dehydratase
MRHFEDFAVGEEFALGPLTVSRDEILAFAAEFDPQPFHLDEANAADSLLGGLAASGWHTAALMMRLMCGWLNDTACLGSPGVSKLQWLRPVRAGDRLAGSSTVVETRASRSRPEIGIVTFRHELENARGEKVISAVNPIIFARRGTA